MSSDDIVIKSPNDRRLYRLIELENGLCALLVHDPEIYSDDSKTLDTNEDEEESVDEDEEDGDEEDEDEDEEEDEEEANDTEKEVEGKGATKKVSFSSDFSFNY